MFLFSNWANPSVPDSFLPGREWRGQEEPQVRLTPLSPLLQNSCPPTAELLGSPGRLFWEPMKIHDIRWNFEKFLVGPDGIPVMRWYHRTTVSNVKMDILSYMRRQAALGARGK